MDNYQTDGADRVEQDTTYLCQSTAVKSGFTVEQADNCDAGNVGCTDCPFHGVAVGINKNSMS